MAVVERQDGRIGIAHRAVVGNRLLGAGIERHGVHLDRLVVDPRVDLHREGHVTLVRHLNGEGEFAPLARAHVVDGLRHAHHFVYGRRARVRGVVLAREGHLQIVDRLQGLEIARAGLVAPEDQLVLAQLGRHLQRVLGRLAELRFEQVGEEHRCLDVGQLAHHRGGLRGDILGHGGRHAARVGGAVPIREGYVVGIGRLGRHAVLPGLQGDWLGAALDRAVGLGQHSLLRRGARYRHAVIVGRLDRLFILGAALDGLGIGVHVDVHARQHQPPRLRIGILPAAEVDLLLLAARRQHGGREGESYDSVGKFHISQILFRSFRPRG